MIYEFDVDIDPIQRPAFDHDPPAPNPEPESIPPLTKALVLAHQIHRAAANSQLTDYAEIAWQLSVTRARISQIVKLRQLAPAIQEIILCHPDRVTHLRERHVRHIPNLPDLQMQLQRFVALLDRSQ